MVMMSVTPGVGFIMIGRGVLYTGMIRVDVLRILLLILVLVMALDMSVLDLDGRTNVSERTKKSSKHQHPTCKDGVKAVLFTRTHEKRIR